MLHQRCVGAATFVKTYHGQIQNNDRHIFTSRLSWLARSRLLPASMSPMPNCLTISSSSPRLSTQSSHNDIDKSPLDLSLNAKAQERLSHIMQLYEDVVGLTEVKEAQSKVVTAEQKFLQVQEDRRCMQADLLGVQADVRAVAADLEKTSRTDSRYIDLVKREHEALLVEKDMTTKIKALDKAERDFFALLSAALRESHEKERARAEKTKYWSIIGSIIGAIIGIVGSTINNMRRMKELRAIVSESGENTAEYKVLADKTLQTVVEYQSKMDEFIKFLHSPEAMNNVSSLGEANISPPLFTTNEQFDRHADTISHDIKKQCGMLSSQVQDIYKLLSVNGVSENMDNVVYAGPEIENLFVKSEEKLQRDIKKNMWVNTIAVSGVVSLGVGLIALLINRGS